MLHVTLLHPGQGDRMDEAWPFLSSVHIDESFTVTAIEIAVGADGVARIDAAVPLLGVSRGERGPDTLQ